MWAQAVGAGRMVSMLRATMWAEPRYVEGDGCGTY